MSRLLGLKLAVEKESLERGSARTERLLPPHFNNSNGLGLSITSSPEATTSLEIPVRLTLEGLERVSDTMSAVCPNCRNHYSSDDQLHDHIQSDCWATRYEQRYPGEWTTSLKRYVHRALDPANRNGWAKADIIEEVKSMIQINRFVSARIRTWDNIELPQDADPRELPYVRSPRLASLYPYTANEKYYPEAYSVTKIGQCPRDVFNHETGELFVAYESSRELLLYADGACTRDGMYIALRDGAAKLIGRSVCLAVGPNRSVVSQSKNAQWLS